jgi:hypothetical protein
LEVSQALRCRTHSLSFALAFTRGIPLQGGACHTQTHTYVLVVCLLPPHVQTALTVLGLGIDARHPPARQGVSHTKLCGRIPTATTVAWYMYRASLAVTRLGIHTWHPPDRQGDTHRHSYILLYCERLRTPHTTKCLCQDVVVMLLRSLVYSDKPGLRQDKDSMHSIFSVAH